MNNMFNHVDMTQILNRIDTLSAQSQPLWGKMDLCPNAVSLLRVPRYRHGHHKPAKRLVRQVGRESCEACVL